MFKHILIPVGLDGYESEAIKWATLLAKKHDARISLLHVVETIYDTSFEELKDFYSGLEKKAGEQLEKTCEEFRKEELDVSSEVVLGHRVPMIVKFAEDNEVDLIVLQSHKVDLNAPSEGWGTISYKVGILSQCPVLLVK